MLEYWDRYRNIGLNNIIPLFQYSIFPLFLLYIALKPVKNIITDQKNKN